MQNMVYCTCHYILVAQSIILCINFITMELITLLQFSLKRTITKSHLSEIPFKNSIINETFTKFGLKHDILKSQKQLSQKTHFRRNLFTTCISDKHLRSLVMQNTDLVTGTKISKLQLFTNMKSPLIPKYFVSSRNKYT